MDGIVYIEAEDLDMDIVVTIVEISITRHVGYVPFK